MEKGDNTLLDVDALMFGGMERLVEPPLTAGVESENEIRLSCEKEMELYLKTPGIPLRDAHGKFTDPLSWWKAVDKAGKFPILCRLAERFLCIPATSAPSERIWSRGGGGADCKADQTRIRCCWHISSLLRSLQRNRSRDFSHTSPSRWIWRTRKLWTLAVIYFR